jgi:hypothetical protein
MYVIKMASCGMMCIPSFLKIDIGIQAILRCWSQKLVLQMRGIYEFYC